uniref:NACHT domain-containing protein n=1 Tax=Astyanax mexicanus TaxID=7994 RepID=A0A3B1IJ83_ASTMX
RKRIRTVLTKGIAGIGKTVSVHKFILDWAEGKENQDIHFMSPLPFRDLNLKRHNRYSLIQLLHQYFTELKELKTISSEEIKTGSPPGQQLPVRSLLNVLTRLRRKRFNKPGHADKIVAHIKSSRSLHIMCHIPVFCWISATVLEERLDKSDCADVPKTLTQMYTHFLLIQTHSKKKKYHGVIQDNIDLSESDQEMITKLAKLAFLQLEKGNLIFYEKDLTECGIDVSTASEYSAICTEIFKEDAVDRALQSENGQFDLFLRFLLGLSLQSNQALLSGLLSNYCEKSSEETVTYIKEKIRNESSAERSINLFHCLNELNYNSLVEEIRNFLRSDRHSETELTPDQCSALAYVLLTSEDVMEEFDLKMCNTSSEGYRRLLPVVKTSRRAMQVFSTLHYYHHYYTLNGLSFKPMLHSMRKISRQFLLNQDCLPAISLKYFIFVFCSLAGANLTDESCKTLASILKSSNSHVTELYLGFNNLGDFGVNLICDGLSDPHCKLEKLNLSHNKLRNIGMKMLCDSLTSPHCKLLVGTSITDQSCELMASVLQSANSNLKELDLGSNNMKDTGVKLLSRGLTSSHCKLEKLRLDRCELTDESCETLATVVQSQNSCLQKLYLSNNNIGIKGVQRLCDGLTHPNCSLGKLDLKKTYETLAFVLQSANPHLKELDLSNNNIGDSAVELLCAGLISPNYFMQKTFSVPQSPLVMEVLDFQ